MTEEEIRAIVREEIEEHARRVRSAVSEAALNALEGIGKTRKPPRMSLTEAANLIDQGDNPMDYA